MGCVCNFVIVLLVLIDVIINSLFYFDYYKNKGSGAAVAGWLENWACNWMVTSLVPKVSLN